MHFDPSGFPGDSLFREILNVYWSTCSPATRLVIYGYGVVLLYICIFGNKKSRVFFVGNIVGLLITCLNPKMCRYLIDNWGFFARYFRLFWLVPVSIGYTLVAADLFERNPKAGKVFLSVVISALFFYSCYQVTLMTGFGDIYTGEKTNTGMIPVTNIYKVEDDLIGVSEIIETDSGDINAVKKTLYGKDIFVEMRTYDPAIIPVIIKGEFGDYDLNACLESNDWFGIMTIFYTGKKDGIDTTLLSSELLKEAMNNVDCEYVILPKTNTYYNIWMKSFKCVGDAGRYSVLRIK